MKATYLRTDDYSALFEQFNSNDSKVVNKALKHAKEINISQWPKMQEFGEAIIPILLLLLRTDNQVYTLEQTTHLISRMCHHAPFRDIFVEQNVLLPLLEMLRLPDSCKPLRKAALQCLARIGENKNRQVPRLIQLLNSKRSYVKKASKHILATTPIIYHVTSPAIDSNFLNEIDDLMEEEVSTTDEENQVGIKKPERRRVSGFQKGLKRTLKKKSGLQGGEDSAESEGGDGIDGSETDVPDRVLTPDEMAAERKRKKKEQKEKEKGQREKEKEKEKEKKLEQKEQKEKEKELQREEGKGEKRRERAPTLTGGEGVKSEEEREKDVRDGEKYGKLKSKDKKDKRERERTNTVGSEESKEERKKEKGKDKGKEKGKDKLKGKDKGNKLKDKTKDKKGEKQEKEKYKNIIVNVNPTTTNANLKLRPKDVTAEPVPTITSQATLNGAPSQVKTTLLANNTHNNSTSYLNTNSQSISSTTTPSTTATVQGFGIFPHRDARDNTNTASNTATTNGAEKPATKPKSNSVSNSNLADHSLSVRRRSLLISSTNDTGDTTTTLEIPDETTKEQQREKEQREVANGAASTSGLTSAIKPLELSASPSEVKSTKSEPMPLQQKLPRAVTVSSLRESQSASALGATGRIDSLGRHESLSDLRSSSQGILTKQLSMKPKPSTDHVKNAKGGSKQVEKGKREAGVSQNAFIMDKNVRSIHNAEISLGILHKYSMGQLDGVDILNISDDLFFNLIPLFVVFIRNITKMLNDTSTPSTIQKRFYLRRWERIVMAFLHRIHSSPAFGLYMSFLEATNNGICTYVKSGGSGAQVGDRKLDFTITIYYSSKLRNNTEKILRELSDQLCNLKTGDVFDIDGEMMDVLSNGSPDNISLISQISVTKVFSSKAKPVLLNLHHPRASEADTQIIVKNGDMTKDYLSQAAFYIFQILWDNAPFRELEKPQLFLYNVFPLLAARDQQPSLSVIQFVKDSIPSETFNWNCLQELQALDLNHFMRTAAAAFMAGYVLGVRDRHRDNMLIYRSSTFFHIDFEHILDQKTRLNDAPCISIHKKMKLIFEKHQIWEEFLVLCAEAYHILQVNAGMLIKIFSTLYESVASQDHVQKFLTTSLMLHFTYDRSETEIRNQVKQGCSGVRKAVKDMLHTAGQQAKQQPSSGTLGTLSATSFLGLLSFDSLSLGGEKGDSISHTPAKHHKSIIESFFSDRESVLTTNEREFPRISVDKSRREMKVTKRLTAPKMFTSMEASEVADRSSESIGPEHEKR